MLQSPCWLCGGDAIPYGLPNKQGVNFSTFADTNASRSPNSDHVCAACAWSLAGAPPETLRLRCHYWAEGVHETPLRSRIAEILLDPPHERFVLTIAVSGQKHIVFRAAVASRGATTIPVQFETETVWLDRAQFRSVLRPYEALLALGCSRKAIDSGNYRYADLKKNMNEIRELDEQIASHRGSALLRVISYCARKEVKSESDSA